MDEDPSAPAANNNGDEKVTSPPPPRRRRSRTRLKRSRSASPGPDEQEGGAGLDEKKMQRQAMDIDLDDGIPAPSPERSGSSPPITKKPKKTRGKRTLRDPALASKEGYVKWRRSCKVPLNGLLQDRDDQTRQKKKNVIRQIVRLVSEARFCVSAVLKCIVGRTLSGPPPYAPLPSFDKEYLYDLLCDILGLNHQCHLVASDRQAVRDVLAAVGFRRVFPLPISASGMQNVIRYECARMSTNLKVLSRTLPASLTIWLRNQLKAFMTPEQLVQEKASRAALMPLLPNLPFYPDYSRYKQEIDTLLPPQVCIASYLSAVAASTISNLFCLFRRLTTARLLPLFLFPCPMQSVCSSVFIATASCSWRPQGVL
jgi:hypothetical protein